MACPSRNDKGDPTRSTSTDVMNVTDRAFKTTEITFESDDGTMLFGKLTTPVHDGSYPVVVWVQTAEAQTVDIRVQLSDGSVIEYLDLYRECLAEMNMAFFSYEGRGVRSGSEPPRYTDIDRPLYNTSTLANKVLDAVAAVRAVREQPSVDAEQVFLIGASEGTLLAAEAATRLRGQVKGIILCSVVSELRDALEWMFTDGLFMQHCLCWDLNGDGVITREEFEADPKGIRRLMPGIGFEVFDPDGDGAYTIHDRRQLSKPVIDALKASDTETVNAWLKPIAAVELPDGWVDDHFNHPHIWTFLSQLDIPVGIFHGELDHAAPVGCVRALEQQAQKDGKTNIEFHYYPGVGHGLGDTDYFSRGVLSEPYRDMFEYLLRQTCS